MFKQLGVPLLGIVENMSVFIPPDMPSKKYEIFGKGGGQTLAKENDLPLLAQIPIEIPLVDESNKGLPISISQPNKESSVVFGNLAKLGLKTGLLDADIYGPNTPSMMGVAEQNPKVTEGSGSDQRLIPINKYGISLVSMGFLIEEGQPVIWRGPMLNSIIRQFLYQVEWNNLDFLVIDLPPGTGDAQISLSQSVPISGAIVVTTPQQVSLQDARRGLAMFKQLGVPLLGIVENMSVFIPPDMPGKKYEIFGKGGGKILAKENDLPLLAQIPIEIPLVDDSNKGVPISISQPNKESSVVFGNLAQLIKNQFVNT